MEEVWERSKEIVGKICCIGSGEGFLSRVIRGELFRELVVEGLIIRDCK